MNRYYYINHALLLFVMIAGCNNIKFNSLSNKELDPSQQDRFQFIVAADPQLFRGKKEDLDKAIGFINSCKPEFFVMCGDLVETPGDIQQIQAYKDSASKLSSEIKLYNVSGNHDLGRPVEIEYIKIFLGGIEFCIVTFNN